MGSKTAVILALVAALAGCGQPAAAGDDASPPPPFQLPTFNPDTAKRPFAPFPNTSTPRKRPTFEPGRAVAMVSDCWPAKSWFRPELSLEARSGQKFGPVGPNDQTQANYVGVVARMPLYSAAELDREREREAGRQQEAAANVGRIVEAITERHRAGREIELFEALETRSRQRVAEGVAETAEQVSALKQVANAHTAQAMATAKLAAARLALLALCQRDRAGDVEHYLNETLGAL